MLHSPPGSGSDTTIRRIAAHLTGSGHSVLLTPDPGDPRQLAHLARRNGIDAMLGTHAYLCGQTFADSDLPYVIVFGGTDLNEFTEDPQAMAVMTEAVDRAAALVAFNHDFVDRCLTLWPRTKDRLHHIPQAVQVRPARFYSLRHALDLPRDARVLLLPSGLRPVKDPLLLTREVSQWHQEDPRIRLVISGVSYDEDFEDIVRRRCARSPGVDFIGPLRRDHLLAAMRQSTAVLNTSLSECSPNAVLEAMALGCRLLVRDIPGNTCLVRDGHNGLVFADPRHFRHQVQRLLDDPALGARLGREAARTVRRGHSPEAERAAYAAVFGRLAAVRPQPRTGGLPVRHPVQATPGGGDAA